MKQCKDLRIVAVEHPNDGYVLLKLTDAEPLPAIRAGQFVEIKVEGSPQTFLRRPISVNFVDEERNELWLLIQVVGEGTRHLSRLQVGDTLNVLFPLGNGFTQGVSGEQVLLVGGGVGIAPLLEYAKQLRQVGATPYLLLGGRSASNLLQLDLFRQYGEVYVTTEDGSMGEQGFVTNHSVLESFASSPLGGTRGGARISCCGPKPMMMAVARWAKQHGVRCEVSLENLMACGLGACLCCVEKTVRGNVCVCKEGPVFDINELTWQI
ncbi:MAG: dihydroorotate dehydrogenase electron transfer subunit [Bacteroidaceae bacterium]|nr:dihydroorotate dehydrogenase electron transfer subunit [Bacteroidaceae bacterium]